MGDDALRARSGSAPHPAGERPPEPTGTEVEPTSAAALTPMMRQYQEWKRRYPDYLLLPARRLLRGLLRGRSMAAHLDIALTARQKIPMAGVPHHALDVYLARLVRAA
jgi:DNA mismatch repair ATPase MutS